MLDQGLPDKILRNEPMNKHTSWKIGGPAAYFMEPKDEVQLQQCLTFANKEGLPLIVVGNGTNLLVSDAGLPSIVVKIGAGFRTIQISDNKITVGAGAMLPAVAKAAVDNGLAGFAWCAGIPGSIGGAVVMNAGANGSCIGQVLKEVKVMDITGQIKKMTKEELGLSYRTSLLQKNDDIVLEATFICQSGNKAEIEATMAHYLTKRKQNQPQGLPNAGSVFKNPPGDSAGRLIELAGCKGLQVGRAQVSTVHANWIVNQGGATANEVLKLISMVQEKVKEKFNIHLQLEVRVLG